MRRTNDVQKVYEFGNQSEYDDDNDDDDDDCFEVRKYSYIDKSIFYGSNICKFDDLYFVFLCAAFLSNFYRRIYTLISTLQ